MPACSTCYSYLERVCIFKVCYRTTNLSQCCKVQTTAQLVGCQLHPVQTQVQSKGRPGEICDRRKWKWGKYLPQNLKVFSWQLLSGRHNQNIWGPSMKLLNLTSFPQLRIRAIIMSLSPICLFICHIAFTDRKTLKCMRLWWCLQSDSNHTAFALGCKDKNRRLGKKKQSHHLHDRKNSFLVAGRNSSQVL